MNAFQFGMMYLHDQLEIMLDRDENLRKRIEDFRYFGELSIAEMSDLKEERKLLETEISSMIEFIEFVYSERKEYQKKKNAGAEATDKTKLTNKIITEMMKNANTYSAICSGGTLQ